MSRTYAYDTENNLTSITDANSNQTAFTYDAYGRVTQTNFPSSLSENYAYDADNNLTSKTDRKGQTITYLYDAAEPAHVENLSGHARLSITPTIWWEKSSR